MGRLAGTCLASAPPPASGRWLNVASEVSSPARMAEAFATAQGTPCVHKKARLRRWVARLLLPDLFEVIEFYRTSTETTDVPALQTEFPGLLTSFAAFLDETGWCDPELTYDDLRAAGCVAVDGPARQVRQ